MTDNFYIYESELCALAYEASKYPKCETGGDLYGLWRADGSPVVFLATGPGKNVIQKDAHYQMDIEYERVCEEILMKNFGIHYLGDWHSHHSLGLYQPSIGDQHRIQKLFARNSKITYMAEIIVNHSSNRKEILTAFVYNKSIKRANVKCLDIKISPVREKIRIRKEKAQINLIEQSLPFNQLILEWPEKPIEEGYGRGQNQPFSLSASISLDLER